MKHLWILDNGHAPSTPGKRSPELRGQRLFEWEFTRSVVKSLARLLADNDIDHFCLTPHCDYDISPANRAMLANTLDSMLPTKQTILVSVHANAFGNDFSEAEGSATLHYPRSTSSMRVAKIFQEMMVSHLDTYDRGLKERDDLSILKRTQMPAIITECAFYTNRLEMERMLGAGFRQKVAESHLAAIQAIDNELQT